MYYNDVLFFLVKPTLSVNAVDRIPNSGELCFAITTFLGIILLYQFLICFEVCFCVVIVISKKSTTANAPSPSFILKKLHLLDVNATWGGPVRGFK